MKFDLMTDFVFLLALSFAFTVSLWMIDISHAGMVCNRPLVGILGIDIDPNFAYHLGLLIATLCFFLAITFLFYLKFKKSTDKNK